MHRPKSGGERLRLQTEFAAAFSRQDPQSNNRAAHFAWIPNHDRVWQIGWSGSIVAVEGQADGSTLVSIKIYPKLYSKIIKTLVLDYVIEFYRVAGHRIELVASDAAIPKLHLQAFPIH